MTDDPKVLTENGHRILSRGGATAYLTMICWYWKFSNVRLE